MATINLLPWRDQRREELKKEFFTILAAVAVAAVVLIMLAGFGFGQAIDAQNSRNQFLQANINELNQQVAEIQELQKKRTLLLERIEVIQALQGTRPMIVRLFDEVVRTVPDGVYYQSLTREGKNILVEGTAESNNRVSSLMRKLDSSDWLDNPNLKGVKANPDFGDQANDFTLNVTIDTPNKAANQEGE